MAYDLLPVNANMPSDTEEFALPMNGKKRNIRRNDFLKFADGCGIPRKSAEKMIDYLLSKQGQWLAMCQESLLSNELKERLETIIKSRCEILDKACASKSDEM